MIINQRRGLSEPTGAYVEGGFQPVLIQQSNQASVLNDSVIIAEGNDSPFTAGIYVKLDHFSTAFLFANFNTDTIKSQPRRRKSAG